ncbi:TMCO1 [Cordylochernes scorpioides]|uniref:TMCO1 n=1 Tax=Cordylochernes scorpioides TaxID=51811 RepID=A0ABY6K7G0_9ARAC|nr:TMCO1 [Cordylochernes scorpioides]
MKELGYALENNDLNKTPGPDGFHGQMISNLGKNGKERLLDIFNNSWKTGKLPQNWKTATIIPIKKLDKSADDPKNYRPISLTKINSSKHIGEVIRKGRDRLKILKYISGREWGADAATLKLTYTSLIRPILEYGYQIYGTASETNLKSLERIQLSAARIITGLRNTCPNDIVLYEADIMPLKDRRSNNLPKYINEIKSNEAADVLAKEGTKEPLPQKNKLTFKEIETIVKTKINKNRRIPPKHSWYSGVNPGEALNIRNRQHQTQLTRFRTGHLKPLKIENNNKIYPTCPKCSLVPAAPEHILACIRCTKQDLWERPLLIKKQLEEHELMEFGKMKSMFVIGFVFTSLLSMFNSIFDGRVVAKLPFVPVSFIQNISHRNLPGEDYTDCSFIFLYLLCTMSIRQNVQKLLGFVPSRTVNKQSGNLFAPAASTSGQGLK